MSENTYYYKFPHFLGSQTISYSCSRWLFTPSFYSFIHCSLSELLPPVWISGKEVELLQLSERSKKYIAVCGELKWSHRGCKNYWFSIRFQCLSSPLHVPPIPVVWVTFSHPHFISTMLRSGRRNTCSINFPFLLNWFCCVRLSSCLVRSLGELAQMFLFFLRVLVCLFERKGRFGTVRTFIAALHQFSSPIILRWLSELTFCPP